jgi:hypothetical protein
MRQELGGKQTLAESAIHARHAVISLNTSGATKCMCIDGFHGNYRVRARIKMPRQSSFSLGDSAK